MINRNSRKRVGRNLSAGNLNRCAKVLYDFRKCTITIRVSKKCLLSARPRQESKSSIRFCRRSALSMLSFIYSSAL